MKFYLKSLLSIIAIPLVVLFSANSVYPATQGTLFLKGIVPARYSILVFPTPTAKHLNIRQGESRKKVATLLERANAPDGFIIKVRSRFGGKLKHKERDIFLPYSLSYDQQDYFSPTNSFRIVKISGPLAASHRGLSELKIDLPAYPEATPGRYEDTITIEISAP